MIFTETFTNPDPEVAYLLDEAKLALANATGIACASSSALEGQRNGSLARDGRRRKSSVTKPRE